MIDHWDAVAVDRILDGKTLEEAVRRDCGYPGCPNEVGDRGSLYCSAHRKQLARTGRLQPIRSKRKLTMDQAAEIRETLDCAQPPSIQSIARRYGVSRSTIQCIRDWITYKVPTPHPSIHEQEAR